MSMLLKEPGNGGKACSDTPSLPHEQTISNHESGSYRKGNSVTYEKHTPQPQTPGCSLADPSAVLSAWLYESLMVWRDGCHVQWDDEVYDGKN
ncbi:hypothetical protein D9757_011264 [Collybiopsis confluens]|uniref:Uncharacterized protein n=1 Tax=Collybiopsis confluens TaxID=2823264 RepID=A0A8H5LPN6_9AGAR|nr:hypothetical protein D9757_011264 [Collybiopsis confluens]